MPLQPPRNPLDSFSWLKEFNVAIFEIINKNSSCTPRLKNDGRTGIDGSTGIMRDGHCWIGFYYFLSRQPSISPWFGLWNEDNGNFSIGILIEHSVRDNLTFIQRLINQPPHYGEHQKFFTHRPNAKIEEQLLCSFSDYMRMGYGKRAANPSFSLNNWITSSTTQESDLKDFFETINAKFLVPYI
jgi:hypothetical protein